MSNILDISIFRVFPMFPNGKIDFVHIFHVLDGLVDFFSGKPPWISGNLLIRCWGYQIFNTREFPGIKTRALELSVRLGLAARSAGSVGRRGRAARSGRPSMYEKPGCNFLLQSF